MVLAYLFLKLLRARISEIRDSTVLFIFELQVASEFEKLRRTHFYGTDAIAPVARGLWFSPPRRRLAPSSGANIPKSANCERFFRYRRIHAKRRGRMADGFAQRWANVCCAYPNSFGAAFLSLCVTGRRTRRHYRPSQADSHYGDLDGNDRHRVGDGSHYRIRFAMAFARPNICLVGWGCR